MIVLAPFTRELDRTTFSCGKPSLDQWLREVAGQHEKNGSCRTTLAVDERETRIAGYFALKTYEIGLDEAASGMALTRRYPLPAMLLARLAVDEKYQGEGLGKFLLVNALHRLARASEDIGFEIVVVDAIDHDASTFYLRYGFVRFVDNPLRLFMATKHLRATFAQAHSG